MHSKDADGIANSVDPDQTTPLGAVRSSLGAVWSGSALFAQGICLKIWDHYGSCTCYACFYVVWSESAYTVRVISSVALYDYKHL